MRPVRRLEWLRCSRCRGTFEPLANQTRQLCPYCSMPIFRYSSRKR